LAWGDRVERWPRVGRKAKERIFLPLEYIRNKDDDPIVFGFPDLGRDPEQSCEHSEMEKYPALRN
jgi:hypothetical protein